MQKSYDIPIKIIKINTKINAHDHSCPPVQDQFWHQCDRAYIKLPAEG